jgi:hypothetical protein
MLSANFFRQLARRTALQNKLHINLTQGIIDVEGDADLVRAIYEDFKDRLTEHISAKQPPESYARKLVMA